MVITSVFNKLWLLKRGRRGKSGTRDELINLPTFVIPIVSSFLLLSFFPLYDRLGKMYKFIRGRPIQKGKRKKRRRCAINNKLNLKQRAMIYRARSEKLNGSSVNRDGGFIVRVLSLSEPANEETIAKL